MFHSRNPQYRSPTGAVAAGTNVHFKISMDRDLRCSAAALLVSDVSGKTERYGMFWCGMNGDHAEWWECDYTPETAGLRFYWFEVDTWRGRLSLNRTYGGDGVLNGKDRWQLTVYAKEYQTPDWLSGGIMYQIFPDRFFRSQQKKDNVPSDRRMHETWEEIPQWWPDETGEITNKDFFGGDLKGIEEKLDYLESLGVTCLYLNPIFESHSNHRYDTADYSRIDPLLGTEEDFRSLCQAAEKRGMKILLDGVFSHTGSDSIYFNREGRYHSEGAYNSRNSPFYSWYTFRHWPNDYECWWNFDTLPNVNETNENYMHYINGKNGIIRKWLRAGAAGWRLDVADELPDEFLDALTAAAKAEKPDAVVLGEVWEDASNKCAYGQHRRYLLGGQLDSVMNYPFRDAILGFLTGANPADMMECVMNILENYPPQTIHCLMNHIGTHDTERALTVLAGEPSGSRGREWQSRQKLSPEQRERGLKLLRLASLLQYTLPGVPCIYYGDEAGMEGYRDPFNRGTYPWGKEDQELVEWYRKLGSIRKHCAALRESGMVPYLAEKDCFAFMRIGNEQAVLVAVNRAGWEQTIRVPCEWNRVKPLLGASPENDQLRLEPYGYSMLLLEASPEEDGE